MRIHRPTRTLQTLLRGYRQYENGGIVTVLPAATLLLTTGGFDIGVDEWVFIQIATFLTKGAAPGVSAINLIENAGMTANVDFWNCFTLGAGSLVAQTYNELAAGNWVTRISAFGFCSVAGLANFDLIATSAGSNSTVAAFNARLSVMQFRI